MREEMLTPAEEARVVCSTLTDLTLPLSLFSPPPHLPLHIHVSSTLRGATVGYKFNLQCATRMSSLFIFILSTNKTNIYL